MDKKPQFSIITVCYNSEATIERTIKSVLAQTFTDYEYLIVDGASSDGTLEIVRRYEPLFNGRLKFKSEPDSGIYNAMNKGIARSSGIIIGIVNSDDWLEPDALEKVYAAYCKNGKSDEHVYTGGMLFHAKDGEKRRLMPNMSALKKYAKLGEIAGIRHPATFVPKKVYGEYGVFDERIKISADADFMIRYYNRTALSNTTNIGGGIRL